MVDRWTRVRDGGQVQMIPHYGPSSASSYHQPITVQTPVQSVGKYLESAENIWSLKKISGVCRKYLESAENIWSLQKISGVCRKYLESVEISSVCTPCRVQVEIFCNALAGSVAAWSVSYFYLDQVTAVRGEGGRGGQRYNLFRIQTKDDIHCPWLTIMEHPSIIGDESAGPFLPAHDRGK